MAAYWHVVELLQLSAAAEGLYNFDVSCGSTGASADLWVCSAEAELAIWGGCKLGKCNFDRWRQAAVAAFALQSIQQFLG